MKNQNNKQNNKKSGRGGMSHIYRNVREPILVDGNNINSAVAELRVDPNATQATSAAFLCPVGAMSPVLTVNGTNVTVGDNTTCIKPRLRWLFTVAANFTRYRVTRATLVFIGNTGSTATGTVTVLASRDIGDLNSTVQVAYAQGGGAKVFDLASSANKEQRLAMPVDSAWKKVSSTTAAKGTAVPFDGFTNQLLTMNSVNDLGFTGYTALLAGYTAQATATTAGSFFIEYDVEFDGPVSVTMNK